MSFDTYVIQTLFTSLIFAFYFFYKGCYKHKTATIIMILFVVFDVLTFFMESPLIPIITIVVRGIIFILLCSLIIKKLNIKTKNHAMILVFSIIVILNGYLIYLLVSSVDTLKFDVIDRVATLFSSIVMVLMCISSAHYNFNKFHLRSTLFMLVTYCLAFGDISTFCGYYLGIKPLFYLERFFTISAFLCFVNYIILENKKREQNSEAEIVHDY